jgi:glutamate-1-semialdehyde 2,1-aminomutase
VPEEVAELTIALPYNDIAAVEKAFKQYRGEIACVIVEPVVGNMGCVPPAPQYLDGLRYLTSREDALLIFDEVMTGFRLSFGGAQELFGTRPDLTTLGKIIGGGLPVGAYGGPDEFMNMIAPLGPVYQAGTLSGNPLAMAAGLATVNHLCDHREIYGRLERNTSTLAAMVLDAAKELGVPLVANRVGSMFTFFFTSEPVTDWASAERCNTKRFAAFHAAALHAGVYFPPSQFEAAFMSAAHTEEDVAQTVAALREGLAAAAEV